MNVAHMSGGEGLFYRLMGVSGGPKVHPFMKLMSKKKRLRAHLSRLTETSRLLRVIPGHGDPIEQGAAEVLGAVAARM
jgi:hypothetical protein